MARLWSSGFELNASGSNIELNNASAAGCSISTVNVRSGTYALRVNPVSQFPVPYFQYSASNLSSIIYYRAYIYVVTRPSTTGIIFSSIDTSINPHISIKMTTTGALQLYNFDGSAQIGSNSAVLNTNQWYRIELAVNTTTLASTVATAYIDGTSFASGTVTTTTGHAGICFGDDQSSMTYNIYWDDAAVNDSSGSFQNGLPGSGSIIHLQPNAAGDNNAWSVQVGGTVGSSNNYTRVSEVTPDDATSYNGDITSGDIDDFNLTDTPVSIGSGDIINVVQVGVRHRAVVASLESAFVVRVKKAASGTVSESSPFTPNSTTWHTNTNNAPFNYPLTLYQDPDSSNWTKATLDTAQIGYRISTTGTNATDISTIWLLVESTIASSTRVGWKSLLGVGQG